MSSTYEIATIGSVGNPDNILKSNWKIKTPSKVRTFVWLVMRGRIMCNVERHRRGFTMDTGCMKCPYFSEDANHVFRSCKDVNSIWSSLLADAERLEL